MTQHDNTISSIHHVITQRGGTEIIVGTALVSKNSIRGCALVCDTFLHAQLAAVGFEALIAIPSGEQAKTVETLTAIISALITNRCNKDTSLMACGGGTTLDVVGLVASTYSRGVPLYLMPTTLLAMVDASIGGKNGVNLAGIKNIVGTVYFPKKVFVDLDFLKTLPEIEMACGLVEMIKHALLHGEGGLQFLENQIDRVLQKDPEALFHTIVESISIKVAIVDSSIDIPEKRNLLNLGHTVGHALEALESFRIRHGQAVALGIIAESFLSMRLGLLPSALFDRICRIVQQLPLSYSLSRRHPVDVWKQLFALDKKTQRKTPRFVLLQGVGEYCVSSGHYCHEVADEYVDEMIVWLQETFLR